MCVCMCVHVWMYMVSLVDNPMYYIYIMSEPIKLFYGCICIKVVDLPKVLLSPLLSVLNASARLRARLPRFCHIFTFIAEQLH